MTLWRIFTRRAQDITASYANPEGRETLPAHPLCIRRRYVTKPPHSQLAQPTTSRTVVRALNFPVATARAEGEPQALDGGAVFFGGTMKRAVVKRWRIRSEHTIHGAQARGGFCRWRSVRYHCTSPARCLRFWFTASGVTGDKMTAQNCAVLRVLMFMLF